MSSCTREECKKDEELNMSLKRKGLSGIFIMKCLNFDNFTTEFQYRIKCLLVREKNENMMKSGIFLMKCLHFNNFTTVLSPYDGTEFPERKNISYCRREE